ncbi:MAG: hypothetical protein EKK37_16200 [Sphingobacteriales bacterium]|nr:MAG: hypothetical protein EKK37_16200 [Sphingobacteriales bacterium]
MEEESLQLADGSLQNEVENTSSAETMPEAEQPEIINEKPQTTAMETHAHDLHKAPGHGWKHYFFEFFMLFLAITLGFFAENLREKISDKKHVHEYIQSMINDLNSDLAMYDSSIAFNHYHCATIDTIITSFRSNTVNSGNIYLLARQLTLGSSVVSPNTKAYEQMKSNGALRLIGKQSIGDSIASYYQWTKKFDYWSGLQQLRLSDVIRANDKLFDAFVFFSIVKGTGAQKDNPPFVTKDAAAINSVLMQYQYYYGLLNLMTQRSTMAKEQAARLIDFLKNEYHLKNE